MIINNTIRNRNKKTKVRALFFLLGIFTLGFGINTSLATGSIGNEYELLPKINFCEKHIIATPATKTLESLEVATSTAKINASINPQGEATKYWFIYGENKEMKQSTGFIYLGNGKIDENISMNISNLSPNTTYFYKIVAENIAGISTGETIVFKTLK